MLINAKHYFLTLLFICSSGCSYFYTDTVDAPLPQEHREITEEPQHSTQVAVRELANQKREVTNVEIIWAVPTEEVDSYVIRYGYDQDRLDHQVMLYTSSLVQEKHARHGSIYRYIIENVSGKRPVFVSMWSIKNGASSQATEVIEASGTE